MSEWKFVRSDALYPPEDSVREPLESEPEVARVVPGRRLRPIWQGCVKLAEEAAELGVEVAKLQAFPVGPHPDGRGVCIDRVKDEMADVVAAVMWFCERNGVELDWNRVDAKVARFAEWSTKDELAGAVVWEDDGGESP